MSDELSTATRIAALEDQVYRLTAENVRLTNEAGELRVSLDASKAREEAYRADVVRLTARADVLAAEVKAWHAAEHLRKDEPHAEFMRLAEARARTRETHALDPAKFEVQP